MNAWRRLTLHYGIRAVILAGFSFYVAHLVRIDKLQYYIAPRMIPYIKIGAMAMFALAGYFAYLALRQSGEGRSATATEHEHACDCDHEPPRSAGRNTVAGRQAERLRLRVRRLYGLFALPLLLGFLLPDTLLGSDVASVKGMNLNAAVGAPIKTAAAATPGNRPEPAPSPDAQTGADPDTGSSPSPPAQEDAAGAGATDELDRLFPADAYTADLAALGKRLYARDTIEVKPEGFLEILSVLDIYKDNFIGKDIAISGFVYREEDMGSDRFVVSRMAMQCCSADAMPYGLLVNSGFSIELAEDDWIAMTGKLTTTTYNDNEIIVLDALKIKKIEAPDDPYVYPYMDDYIKLADT